MKPNLLLRRLHLYLGLALFPWVLMYGLSSLPFAHADYFQKRDVATGKPLWTLRFERPYDAPVPTGATQLRAFGLGVLQEIGIEAPNVGVSRPNQNTVNISAFSFLKTTRVVYAVGQKKLTVEDRRFRFDQFLTGMHARGGFNQEGFLQDSWGVLVDVVCLTMVLWIATGLCLWWGLSSHRAWGLVALLAGLGSFLFFALRL
jgi:hypothetical protein